MGAGRKQRAAQTRLAVVDMNPISTPPLMLNLSPVVKASGSFRPANPRYTFPPLGVNGPSFDMADEIRLHASPNVVLLWLELKLTDLVFRGRQSYSAGQHRHGNDGTCHVATCRLNR